MQLSVVGLWAFLSVAAVLITYYVALPSDRECTPYVTHDAVDQAADRDERMRLEKELHAVTEQLQRAEASVAQWAGCKKTPATARTSPGACLRPKYHISAMLSSTGVSCQDHGLFLRGHVDPVVVECGAAGGVEAAELSHIARVYTYEANPANMPEVKRFVETKGVPERVQFRHAACGNRTGTIDLYTPQGSAQSQTASLASQEWWSGNSKKVEVPIIKLEDEIHEHVTLLKLDVQGAEPDVVDGARGLIAKHGVDIIHMEFQPMLQVKNGRDPPAFLKMVYDLGYHCFDCRFMRRVQSPNRDFYNFTYDNFITPFEPKFFRGVIGGISDLVCISHFQAPGDHWEDKAVPYRVSYNNTKNYPKSRSRN